MLRLTTAPCVCALGWVKCREHISLLIILCIIVYVTNKTHLSLIFYFCIQRCYYVSIVIYYCDTCKVSEWLFRECSSRTTYEVGLNQMPKIWSVPDVCENVYVNASPESLFMQAHSTIHFTAMPLPYIRNALSLRSISVAEWPCVAHNFISALSEASRCIRSNSKISWNQSGGLLTSL